VLGKQGVSLWSSEPGAAPFTHDDVSEATARETSAAEFVDAPEGPARIATYTVVYQEGEPKRLVAIAELEDGRRALASSEEPGLVEPATREDLCGRGIRFAVGAELDWL
jgi:uncharacterized OB-fold protein